jgi:hypothetical protein
LLFTRKKEREKMDKNLLMCIKHLEEKLLQKEEEKLEVHGLLIKMQKQVWKLQDELEELKKKA